MMKNLFYFLIIILSFYSCESFFEGKQIELDNKIEEGLAAYCILNLDDTTIFVQVSKTFSYGQPFDTTNWGQENIIVELYQNGNLLFDIPIEEPFGGVFYDVVRFKKELNQSFRNFHQPDATYELIVNSEKDGILRATQKFPNTVLIDSTNYRESVRITAPYFTEEDLHQVTFTDPIDDENYYWIDAILEQTMTYDSMTFNYDFRFDRPNVYDALLNVENDIVTFSDENINGQTYKVDIYHYTWKGSEPNSYINYQLHSISKDLYLYLKTLDEYNTAAENPFAEPTLLYHNMEGGLGIFGVYQTEEKRVRIR